MINSDNVTKENIKEWNLNWPWMSDHLNGILIIWRHRIWKNNFLFNLINHKPAIEKFYLYAKDSFEAKYQSLINRRERTGLKHFNVSKIFFWYSNSMDDIYKSIDEYKPNKKQYWSFLMIWLLICLATKSLI